MKTIQDLKELVVSVLGSEKAARCFATINDQEIALVGMGYTAERDRIVYPDGPTVENFEAEYLAALDLIDKHNTFTEAMPWNIAIINNRPEWMDALYASTRSLIELGESLEQGEYVGLPLISEAVLTQAGPVNEASQDAEHEEAARINREAVAEHNKKEAERRAKDQWSEVMTKMASVPLCVVFATLSVKREFADKFIDLVAGSGLYAIYEHQEWLDTAPADKHNGLYRESPFNFVFMTADESPDGVYKHMENLKMAIGEDYLKQGFVTGMFYKRLPDAFSVGSFGPNTRATYTHMDDRMAYFKQAEMFPFAWVRVEHPTVYKDDMGEVEYTGTAQPWDNDAIVSLMRQTGYL